MSSQEPTHVVFHIFLNKNVGKNSDSHNVKNFTRSVCRADQKHTLISTQCIKVNLRHGCAHQVLLVQRLCSQTYRWNWTWIAASDGPGNSLMLPDQDVLGRIHIFGGRNDGDECALPWMWFPGQADQYGRNIFIPGKNETRWNINSWRTVHGRRGNGKSMFSPQFWWNWPTSFPIHSSVLASISRCSLHE